MKKSIFWRATLTIIVLGAWSLLLIPFSDKEYIPTFENTISISDKVLEARLKVDYHKRLLDDRKEAFVKRFDKKEFDKLEQTQKDMFWGELNKEQLELEALVTTQLENLSSSEKAAKKAEIKKEMMAKLTALLAKASELKAKADKASKDAEIANKNDPNVKLIPNKSIETIILDLARGDSGIKGFDEFLNLGHYVNMVGKDTPSNTDVAFFIRNCTRSRLKFGLDLAGGTEFVIAFDEADVVKFNEGKKGRKYSAEMCRDMVIETLRNRVDPHGVKEVEIRPNTATSISIRTPITDEAEIQSMRSMLDRVGKLEFYIVDEKNEANISQKRQTIPGFKKLPLKNRNVQNSFIWVKETAEPVTGEDVSDAGPAQDELGQWYVSMNFSHTGGAKMKRTTGDNIGKRMAISLDGVVFSAPTIQSAIGSRGQITGDFTQQDAQKLGVILKSGSLPVQTRVDSMMTTDPTLGGEFVNSGKMACLYGMLLVVAFMLFYYRVGGIIAIIALAGNILLIIGSMPLVQAALTLPGIAGIVLTIGMAVDANVLIFERIREESIKGKSIATAVKNGYSRAFWTILDANLTTLFTAFFLYKFGSGTIKGFAVTLTLGILASMFTALFVTRWIFDFLIEKNILTSMGLIHCKSGSKYTEKNMYPDHPFISLRKMAGMVSAVLFIGAIIIFGAKGGGLSTDFTGGTQILMQYDQKAKVDEVNKLLKAEGYENARVTYKGKFTTSLIEVVIGGEKAKEKGATEKLVRAMNTKFPDANFKDPAVSVVGNLISGEFAKSAILSIIFALVVIILYISFRFEFGYGVGAVAALVHDVVICTGLYLMCGRQVSLTVIAALLTIIGYSLNDTIVVFDRIRENLEFHGTKKKNFLELVNMSLNQTLSRTLLTSLTTLLVVATLYLFGGGAIDDFALIMIFGVIVGTYSSIFIATPVMIIVQSKLAERREAAPAKKSDIVA